MNGMKITYYHTLYKREVTENVFGAIEFKDGKCSFSSMGHRESIGAELIRKIEPMEE